MYLNIMNNKKTGTTTLSIRRGYRDTNGKVKNVTVEYLGKLDDLKKEYDDPIAHFKDVVNKMNEEEKLNKQPIIIKIDKNEKLTESTDNLKNFGYAALSKIYHELEIDKFIINKFKSRVISEFKLNNILKLLVFARALFPDSKKSTYENKNIFFENTDFSLQEVYNALTYIEPFKEKLQQHIYDHIQEQYKPNNECIYYDVTNYYFEIDEPDELRKKGVSKEHRPNPIVQMGLFMDSLGLPINYKLFSGNTNDCLTLRPMVQELQKNYDVGKVIVVADKGLNTGNNIAYNKATGNGYVMSLSLRGANAELKEYVLKEDGYSYNSDKTYKVKSRIYPREIIITKLDKATGKIKKTRKNVDEKQVIFWSADYAKRAKAERQPAIDKAKELIGNVQKFNKANSYGASKYVKHLVFDKSTGEIIVAKSQLSLNEDKIAEEEKYDGYYSIVTSELHLSDNEIIKIYGGLWEIEESFRIIKSEFSARPIYVSTEDHIDAHFLICFVSLLIFRILEYKLENKYTTRQIRDSLINLQCSHLTENCYLLDFRNEVIEQIEKNFDIDFSNKIMKKIDIKKFLQIKN